MGLIKKIIYRKNNGYSKKDLAKLIGIEASTLSFFINNKVNINSNDELKKLNLFYNNISSIVSDEEFIQNIDAKISFVKNYGSFNVSTSSIKGKVKSYNLEYLLEIYILNDKVEFNVTGEKYLLSGSYTSKNNNSHIEYVYKKINVNPNDSYDDFTVKRVYICDENNTQIYKYREMNLESFNVKEYFWRAKENKIIGRYIKKYDKITSSLSDVDYYLVGKNQHPDNKKLIEETNYYLLEKELFQKYVSGKYEINELWNKNMKKNSKKLIKRK